MNRNVEAAPLLRPLITTKGLQAAVEASTLGKAVKIVKVGITETPGTAAVGDTALPGAKMVDVADGRLVNDHQVNVSALLPDTFPSMGIAGIAFYLEDGTMFAVYREVEAFLEHTGGTTLLVGMDLVMDNIPSDSVIVESTGAKLILGDWVPIERRVNGKALTADIMLNANDVNAAPSGFGLGVNAPALGDVSCDTVMKTGWNSVNNATPGTPNGTGPSGSILHTMAWGGSAVHQVFHDYANGKTHKRTYKNNVWGAWKADYDESNPPPAVDLSGYVPKTRKVNEKALDADITLTPSDVGAAPASHSHSNYVETTRKVNGYELRSDVTLGAADVKAVAKAGDTMDGTLSMGSAGKIAMNMSALIGANNSVFMRDFGNGNVVLAGGLSSEGVAGALYLGYRGTLSGTAGYNTSNVRLNSPLVNSSNGILVSEGGLINSELLEGPIRTELDEANIRHTIVGGTDTRNRGRTLIAAGECGAKVAANTSTGQESVHIAGDGNDGVYIHTGVTDWGSATHKITKFQAGEIYVGQGDSRVYHQGYKPTSGDVGAYPITGGTLNGALSTTGLVTAGRTLVSNTGPSAIMEMLIPGKVANMVYTDAAGGNMHFAQSDGAGATVTSYANFHQSALTFYKQSNFASNISADGFVTSRSALRCDASYPMVELHSKDKAAYAMYVEPTDRTLRFAQSNGAGTIAKQLALITTAGDMQISGNMYAGNGAARLMADGMVTGPVWGGDGTIASWCRATFHPLVTDPYQVGAFMLGTVRPQAGISVGNPGYHVLGSHIHPCGVIAYSENRGITLPGTWSTMGAFNATNIDDNWEDRATLFMRIM